MNRTSPILFSVFLLLFVSISVPADAQTTPVSVVINEVDLNPPGNDASSVSEWIELYNPTGSDVDMGGWQVASTTVLKKTMTIPDGTVIKPGQFLTYSYQSVWFTDSNESVELRDDTGTVVDKTPTIEDTLNDFTSWQRLYDGYDSDSASDWKFATSTAGSSNGKLVEVKKTDGVSVSVMSVKASYMYGESAVIRGSVSEEVFVEKPSFKPESITMTISGPNFHDVLTLYPDLDLNFEASLNLHQVLGINEGDYDVLVSYAGATDTASFSVGYEISQSIADDRESEIRMATDKSQYMPGEFVSLTGTATDIIPFEGMKFTIVDANDGLIAEGNLFPTGDEFKTRVFVSTVDPIYGTYTINAKYSEHTASSTFDVVEDVKEDTPISLWTDEKAYGLGETVQVTGRLNDVWISTLDLEIVQTKQTSLDSNSAGSNSGFKILDGVQIQGDGTFAYDFTIPDGTDRLGDYKITVSKEIGTATAVVSAVEDPDSFVASDEPITISLNKKGYAFGDTVHVSGFINDPFGNSSYQTGSPVKVSVTHEDGTPLEMVGLPKKSETLAHGGIVVGYGFTAIPELSGRYSVDVDISKNIFTVGNYVVRAEYHSDSVEETFSVVDVLDLDGGALISTEKDIYGLGDVVHLSGILPPLGTSSVEVTLTRPDGTKTTSGAFVDEQRFSWSWNVPSSEKTQNLKEDDGRNAAKSNFGVYKITVSTGTFTKNIFFKVSSDPLNDSMSKVPIYVGSEKSLYMVGEKLRVTGNVIPYNEGVEGLVIPERVLITVLDGTFPFKQIHSSEVYPDQGGDFSSLFELPPTIFSTGEYTIKANYMQKTADSKFSVANDYAIGIDGPVSLLLSIDAAEYFPGDTVTVTGKPNKLVYFEKYDLSVTQKTAGGIECDLSPCGDNDSPATSIRPSPSGSFVYEYLVPETESAIGSFEVTVDADFETQTVKFDVVEKPESTTPDMPAKPDMAKPHTVIEKANRISEKNVEISIDQKMTDNGVVSPRVISGLLMSPARDVVGGGVDLKISAMDGTCVIGPSPECLVKESTRKPGQIYETVEINGDLLNVRYSGPDVRLEKFSILPESSDEFLSGTSWNVEILKDEQVSRFYYKVTYKAMG